MDLAMKTNKIVHEKNTQLFFPLPEVLHENHDMQVVQGD